MTFLLSLVEISFSSVGRLLAYNLREVLEIQNGIPSETSNFSRHKICPTVTDINSDCCDPCNIWIVYLPIGRNKCLWSSGHFQILCARAERVMGICIHFFTSSCPIALWSDTQNMAIICLHHSGHMGLYKIVCD